VVDAEVRGDPSGAGVRARFEAAPSRVSFPDLEQDILAFWREHDVFRRSIEERPADKLFSFYEGPPTANGTPGVHHVLARVFKDLIPRYKTMRGYRAPRKGGWDTHGLPVELEVERELGLRNKRDIEEYGVAAFNAQCRESVFRYVSDWERMTERIGFWIDTDDAYVTYSNEYVESCWWVLQRLWDNDLIFRDYRVTPHCPRCGTSLSSHEIALGYQEDTPDPSVTVLFTLTAGEANAGADEALRLADDVPTSVLAWTTTPWTLPGNTALAVAPEAEYALVEDGDRRLIVAEARRRAVLPEALDDAVLARFEGSALVGLRYQPLYESREWDGVETLAFIEGRSQFVEPGDAPARRIVGAEFVATDDGTGVVHIAPAFGEEDYELGRDEGLMFLEPVALDGTLTGGPFDGRFVKEADPDITADLDARGLLLTSETIHHTYPFCWRCDTPVLYYAKPSWYIRTTAVRDALVANNQDIHWVPNHIRDGRFGEWLDGNVDWALSRERYWGTPLPFWTCAECRRTDCIGSYEELAERAGLDAPPPDPHRPFIDDVTLPCRDCGGEMRRTPEVADAWFDSGAMPYAQSHYPFENQETFEERFPADFICEAVDQTRGWFYTLHALATLLHSTGDVSAGVSYRNVICLGLIEDAEGQKMSKSRGNIVDHWEVLDAYGADALRWTMYTAAPPGNSRRFSPEIVRESQRRVLSTLWNTYSFFVTYANIAGFDPASAPAPEARTELDRWVRSELHQAVRAVTEALDDYEPLEAARPIAELIEQLSNWYVRRSRRRFWKSDDSTDTRAALHTLYECLTTLAKLIAPFTPFLAEALYRNLEAGQQAGAPDSVHLAAWPEADAAAIDEQLSRDVALVQRMVSLGRGARSRAGMKVRQPLASAVLIPRSAAELDALERLAPQIADELNVQRVEAVSDAGERLVYSLRPNLPALGPRYGREVGRIRAAIADANPRDLVATMRAEGSLELDGFDLSASDILVDVEAAEGWSAAEDAGYSALVETALTPELVAEGIARDVVRRLQDLRREAGLDITDRIHVRYEGGDDLRPVLDTHGEYVSGETLALSLEPLDGDAPDGAASTEASIEGIEVRLVLWRA